MKTAIFCVSMFLASAMSHAQTCNMSGKTLIYSYSTCNFNNLECSNGMLHEKILFLGEKILRFPTVDSKEGEVFYQNRTVDQLNDSLQNPQFSRTLPPGTKQRWTLTAEWNGTSLALVQRGELTNDSTGSSAGTVLWERDFRITNCNSCEMTAYRFTATTPGGRRIDFHLMAQSCEITN